VCEVFLSRLTAAQTSFAVRRSSFGATKNQTTIHKIYLVIKQRAMKGEWLLDKAFNRATSDE
jgi:hypothetical protein